MKNAVSSVSQRGEWAWEDLNFRPHACQAQVEVQLSRLRGTVFISSRWVSTQFLAQLGRFLSAPHREGEYATHHDSSSLSSTLAR